MVNEIQFKTALTKFTQKGQSVPYYMNAAYSWLGWGIKGNREVYAWDYQSKLVMGFNTHR